MSRQSWGALLISQLFSVEESTCTPKIFIAGTAWVNKNELARRTPSCQQTLLGEPGSIFQAPAVIPTCDLHRLIPGTNRSDLPTLYFCHCIFYCSWSAIVIRLQDEDLLEGRQ